MLAQGNKLNVKDRLIVALDVSSIDEAKEIVKDLREDVGMFQDGSGIVRKRRSLLVRDDA